MAEKKSPIRAAGFVLVVVSVVALMSTGCIRSMVRVTSDPSDARVFLNNVERGRTPIEMPIEWYWWYTIRVEKEGYEPLEKNERFYAPPWAVPPFDLIFDPLPIPIKNTYKRHYVMKPKRGD
jgi:hypothetical protein